MEVRNAMTKTLGALVKIEWADEVWVPSSKMLSDTFLSSNLFLVEMPIFGLLMKIKGV